MNLGPATVAFYRALGREKNGARIHNARQLIQAVLDERDEDGDEQPALTAGT